MTPLQALERIGNRGLNDYGEATIKTVFKEEYNLLTSLITPPTANDICEAIKNDLLAECYFDGIRFNVVERNDDGTIKNGIYIDEIQISAFSHSTLIKIGRFYEVKV